MFSFCRIERLWRDVKSKGIVFYIKLFKTFEKNGMSIDDEWHLFVLHYMFYGRIQEELNEFKSAWNNHQVSTEGNETPLQMLIMREESFPDPVDVDEEYGRDEENELSDSDDDEIDNGVNYSVPCDHTFCPLSAPNLAIFKARVQPLRLDTPSDDLANWFYVAIEFVLEIKENQLA